MRRLKRHFSLLNGVCQINAKTSRECKHYDITFGRVICERPNCTCLVCMCMCMCMRKASCVGEDKSTMELQIYHLRYMPPPSCHPTSALTSAHPFLTNRQYSTSSHPFPRRLAAFLSSRSLELLLQDIPSYLQPSLSLNHELLNDRLVLQAVKTTIRQICEEHEIRKRSVILGVKGFDLEACKIWN